MVRLLRAGRSVLHVGCGDGSRLARVRAEAALAGKAPGRLVGVDPSVEAVARAGSRRGVRALPGEGPVLPFADQAFDVVFVGHVRYVGPDPARAARELFRVTEPGGTIIVELPAANGFGRELVRAIERLPDLTLLRDGARNRLLVARVAGPRSGRMPVEVSGLPGWTSRRVARLLAGVPVARGYRLVIKPLRYRTRPHVQAFCEFDTRRIVIQIPVPFRAFSEVVPYKAQRVAAKGFHFRWYRRRVRFDRPQELIRYLYLHEYYHWYLREALGRPSAAETACDRFALQWL